MRDRIRTGVEDPRGGLQASRAFRYSPGTSLGSPAQHVIIDSSFSDFITKMIKAPSAFLTHCLRASQLLTVSPSLRLFSKPLRLAVFPGKIGLLPRGMTELEELLNKARQLAEARNHKLLPFVRRGSSAGSRCVTCGRQVYVMPDAGLIGAAIGGDAIAEVCIRKPSASVRTSKPTASAKR